MKYSRIYVLILCLAALLFNAGSALAKGDEEEDPLIGTKAADFTLPRLMVDGEVTLGDYLGKKPIVLDFFELWCTPCKKNLPLMEEFYKAHKDKVEVFIITSAEDVEVLDDYFSDPENKISFPILHDPDAETAQDYPHKFFPYIVLIDKSGVIIGSLTEYDEDLVSYLEETLGL